MESESLPFLAEAAVAAPSAMTSCPRSTLRRAPQRGSTERERIYGLIDRLKTAHVAFVEDGEPRCIPLTVWRSGDAVFLHVLNGGRISRRLSAGAMLCLSFAETTAWVMSKSAYHHSANYESAVLFGTAEQVHDADEFDSAFAAIINQLEPGRWDQVRPPNNKERKATALFRIPLQEGSFKARSGGPNEEPEDLALPVWHGTLPAR